MKTKGIILSQNLWIQTCSFSKYVSAAAPMLTRTLLLENISSYDKFYEIWGQLTFRNHSVQIPNEATELIKIRLMHEHNFVETDSYIQDISVYSKSIFR